MNIKYCEKEDDLCQLVTHLAEKIMKNRAYQDGNKRTALVTADMFLKINGFSLQEMPTANDAVNGDIYQCACGSDDEQVEREVVGTV